MSKTKTSGMSKNQAKAVVAVLLSAALLVGGGAVGYGMATDWTYQKATQIEQPDDQEQTTAGNAIITPDTEASNGIKLMSATISPESYEEYGISTLAESAFSLTVTITPSNATYQAVDIAATWKNPLSEWASGKSVSDYLTINQTSDGSLTATGTVLQAFSEPIEITATLRGQEEITAKAQVDYVGTLAMDLNYSEAVDISSDVEIVVNGIKNGTITPDLTDSVVVRLDVSDVANRMKNYGYTIDSVVEYVFTPESADTREGIATIRGVFLKAGNITHGSPEMDEYWAALSKAVLNNRPAEEHSGDEIFSYQVSCNRKYNGVTYDTVTIVDGDSYSLDDWSGFVVPADSMSFDNSQIVVG